MSLLLEKAFLNLWGKIKKKGLLLAGTFLLLLFSWSLRIGLFIDLKNSQFPVRGGYSLTYQDIDNFLKEKSIATSDAQRKVAWFTGYTNNVGNLSFEKVVEKDYKDVKYILWPYWNIGPLYSTGEVDREAHNQRYFVKNYASEVTFRFPTLISRYMHAMKYFAWHYLRATWNPEMDSMIEPQYGLVTLKGQPTELILNYLVGAEGISRYFSPYSLTFNFRNLPDTYIFPPCASHPDVKRVVDGSEVDILPPLAHNGIGGKTAGLYCHSLWFRVFPRGVYYIRFEGLPPDFDNSQKVYSNLQFQYDPGTRTIVTGLAETRITAEFGVATKEADLPNLKFRVFYQSLPFKDSAKVKK